MSGRPFLLGGTISCDLSSLVDTRLLIQANSGAGKSWCLRRILEQTHGRVQQLVIDPEGEFASLREKFDYVLAARSGGDTAADPRAAKLLAERLLELGVSAVLDIYELKAHERVRFVRAVLEALVDAPKTLWHPALVVVDEAHVYCPQKGEAESADAVIDLCTRGRKRGFCAVLATQRLSKLHKDAAAELNNKLIGRTSLDVDMARAAEELGFAGREERFQLRTLEAGEFFCYGPAVSQTVARVKIGPVQTSHPKPGARLAHVAPRPTEKVRALLPKLADLPAEAEERQKSLNELKRALADTRRQLTLAQKSQAPAPAREKLVEKRVEIPVLKDVQITRLEKFGERIVHAGDVIMTAVVDLGRFGNELTAAIRTAKNGQRSNPAVHARRIPAASRPLPLSRPQPRSESKQTDVVPVGPSRQRILDVLAWLEVINLTPVHKTQVAIFAGQSPKSGGYFNNLGSLRSAGLIDYPQPTMIALTEAGRSVTNPSDTPGTSEELHRQLAAQLPRSQWAILKVCIDAYPENIEKGQVAEQVGQSPTSGGFFNNLGRLRSLGLIEYPKPGRVAALPVLFLEEAR